MIAYLTSRLGIITSSQTIAVVAATNEEDKTDMLAVSFASGVIRLEQRGGQVETHQALT
jgi:hypothetical protein